MIICGFPGIGKTTYARANSNGKVVDLDSSNFDIHTPEGIKAYCTVARVLQKMVLLFLSLVIKK